jgi:hypothetical protein
MKTLVFLVGPPAVGKMTVGHVEGQASGTRRAVLPCPGVSDALLAGHYGAFLDLTLHRGVRSHSLFLTTPRRCHQTGLLNQHGQSATRRTLRAHCVLCVKPFRSAGQRQRLGDARRGYTAGVGARFRLPGLLRIPGESGISPRCRRRRMFAYLDGRTSDSCGAPGSENDGLDGVGHGSLHRGPVSACGLKKDRGRGRLRPIKRVLAIAQAVLATSRQSRGD